MKIELLLPFDKNFDQLAILEIKRKLGRVNFRKVFWDCTGHREKIGQ